MKVTDELTPESPCCILIRCVLLLLPLFLHLKQQLLSKV